MKKLETAIILILLTCLPAFAQKQITYMPVDPEVRTGVLPNGLSYYVRHNEEPLDGRTPDQE